MTRNQWNEIRDSQPYGGDFWNTAQIYRAAFRRADVVRVINLGQRLSGLYADPLVEVVGGVVRTMRLYS